MLRDPLHGAQVLCIQVEVPRVPQFVLVQQLDFSLLRSFLILILSLIRDPDLYLVPCFCQWKHKAGENTVVNLVLSSTRGF